MPITTPPPITLKLNVLGTTFDPGTPISVQITAPANGNAYALICGTPPALYQLPAVPSSPGQPEPPVQNYVGTIPAPLTDNNLSCPIIGEYVDPAGTESFVYGPLVSIIPPSIESDVTVDMSYVAPEPARDHQEHRSSGTPQPKATATPKPVPTPTPAPVIVPKPIYTRYPDPTPAPRPVVVEPQPAPVQRVVEQPAPVQRVIEPQPAPVQRVVEQPAPVERQVERETSTPTPKATRPPEGDDARRRP